MTTFKQFLLEIEKLDSESWKGDSLDISSAITDIASKLKKLYKEAMPLPGGSNFKYNTIKRGGTIDILIFDDTAKPIESKKMYSFSSDKNASGSAPIVGHLQLDQSNHVRGAWISKVVSVIKKYRGQRIGLALYGIALDILKLTLLSDTQQTYGGVKMWSSIKGIPNVRVFALIDNEDLELKDLPKGSGQYVDDKLYFAIPVEVNNHGELSTGSKGFMLYTDGLRSNDLRLIAKKVT